MRRPRRNDRRPQKVAVEVQALEQRQVLSWTPLGFSLPDLTISGFAAPVAAYGEEIAVTVRVQNLGASSILEPLSLEPGAISTADAPPSTAAVYLSRSPNFGRGAIKIGEIDVPFLQQNSVVEITDTVTMPSRLPGLPGSGGTVYLFFRADADRTTTDYDRTNNTTLHGVPVEITAALPELVGLSIDVPPVMQPGDAIAPSIKIANYGSTNPNQQVESFEVVLVASTDQNFGPGDVVLATYTVRSLPPLALVPMQHSVLGDVNVDDPINIITLETITPIVLPSTPGQYFVGVIVDPQNTVREIGELRRGPSPRLQPIAPVGPPIANLPPAGVVVNPLPNPGAVFPFTPYTPSGRLPRLYEDLLDPPIIVDPVANLLAARRAATEATGQVRLRVGLGQVSAPTSTPAGPAGQIGGRRLNRAGRLS